MTLNTNTQEKKQHNKNKKKRSLLNQSIYEYSYSLYFHSINTYSIRPYDTLYSLRTLNFKEILDISQLKKKKEFSERYLVCRRSIYLLDPLVLLLLPGFQRLRSPEESAPHHTTSRHTAQHRTASYHQRVSAWRGYYR